VYIIFIPALGFVSAIIVAHARRELFGYTAMVLAQIANGFIAFGLWVHHMFATDLPQIGEAYFTASSMMIAITSGVQIFCWLATLWSGRPRLTTALHFVYGFIVIFVLGGMTGVMLASVPLDLQAHDTYFVVAHFHYVMMGSTLVAFLGALHYWWPKFTGRMYPESLGKACAIGVFCGFNLTFLPQFVMGARGMPRRYWDYDPQYQIYHQLSTIGAFVLGVSIFVTVVSLVASFWTGKKAPRNPWGGSSLEWQAPTPPPLYNFEKPPVLHELYNYDDLVEIEEDRWERRAPTEIDEPDDDAATAAPDGAPAADVPPTVPPTVPPGDDQ
jgi:cytochrome c oxidase subunit 1